MLLLGALSHGNEPIYRGWGKLLPLLERAAFYVRFRSRSTVRRNPDVLGAWQHEHDYGKLYLALNGRECNDARDRRLFDPMRDVTHLLFVLRLL